MGEAYPAEADLGEPTTLVLVRHARTAVTGRTFTGGGPGEAGHGPPLDAAGELEAARLADALAARSDLPPITTLLHSPFVRTTRTAEVLGPALGLVPVVDEGWVEVTSLEASSLADLVTRMGATVARVRAEHARRCVVVVSHAGPVRAVLAAALEAGQAALWRLRVDPASVSVVRYWADGGVEVAVVNDTSHLR